MDAGKEQFFDQRLNNIEIKLDSIATAIAAIAVQDEKIINLQSQMSKLWEKFDEACGPEGTLARVKQNQAKCPKSQIKWLWTAICSMALMVIAKFLTG